MSAERAELAVRSWLQDEAASLRTPAPLRLRVAAIPSTAARPFADLSRRSLVLALAATIAAAILLGAVAILSQPPTRPRSFHVGQLAYRDPVTADIVLVNTDGSAATTLTNRSSTGLLYGKRVSWFGDRLVYTGDTYEVYADTNPVSTHLLSYDARYQTTQEIAATGAGGARWLGTPDGRRFALLRQVDVTIVDADGRLLATMFPPSGYERWDLSAYASFDWSSSGDTLLLSACTDVCFRPSDLGRRDLFLIRLDGTATKLTTDDLPALKARLSPDASRVAFESLTADTIVDVEGDQSQLWVVDADGKNTRRLIVPPGVALGAWSPDGTRIAFLTRDRAYGYGPCPHACAAEAVGFVTLDDSQPALMTGTGLEGVQELQWWPDGSAVLAVAVDGPLGRAALWSLPTDRTKPVLVGQNLDPEIDGYAWQIVPNPGP